MEIYGYKYGTKRRIVDGHFKDFIQFSLRSGKKFEGTLEEEGKDYYIVKLAYPPDMYGLYVRFEKDEINILRRIEGFGRR